jgi:hypothetical protein
MEYKSMCLSTNHSGKNEHARFRAVLSSNEPVIARVPAWPVCDGAINAAYASKKRYAFLDEPVYVSFL